MGSPIVLSQEERHQIRDTLWRIGSLDNLSVSRRKEVRRRIFRATEDDRILNRFVAKMHEKYMEVAENVRGRFIDWLLQYIIDHPEVIFTILAIAIRII